MSISIDREHMRAKSHIMKIAVVCALILLVKGSSVDNMDPYRVNNDYYKEHVTVRDLDVFKRTSSISIVESEKLNLLDCMDNMDNLRIITNLSSDKKVDKEYMIIEKSKDLYPYHPETTITCLYKKVYINNSIKRESVYSLGNLDKFAKRILVSLVSENTREVYERRMQKAEEYKKNFLLKRDIIDGFRFLIRVMNIHRWMKYDSEMNKNCSLLKDIVEINTSFYNIAMDNIWIDDLRNILSKNTVMDTNFIYYMILLRNPNYINGLVKKYERILEELERERNIYSIGGSKQTRIILKKDVEDQGRFFLDQIKDFEREYDSLGRYAKSKESLLQDSKNLLKRAKDLTVVYINALTEEGIALSKQENGVLSRYISESSKEIEDKAAPWNKNLVIFLINSWIRYNKAEENLPEEIEDIEDTIELISHENTSFMRSIIIRSSDISLFVYLFRSEDALKEMIKLLKKELDTHNHTTGHEYNETDTEIPKKALDCLNIEICNNIVSILAGITQIEKDPKIIEELSIPIKERIHPLIYKISECYTNFTSIETLIKSVEKNKKEIVDSFFSIVFNDYLMPDSIRKDMDVLNELTKEMLNSFADVMHYRFAVLINYNKSDSIAKLVIKEKLWLLNHSIKKPMKCLLRFAKDFWYAPDYYSGLISLMERTSRSEDTSVNITEEWYSDAINQISMFTYQAYKSINDMAMCDEIWWNPAVLYIEKSSSKNKLSYFIYSQDGTTYISDPVSNSNSLEVIKNAQTHLDITKVIGKKKKTTLKFGETLSTQYSWPYRYLWKNFIK